MDCNQIINKIVHINMQTLHEIRCVVNTANTNTSNLIYACIYKLDGIELPHLATMQKRVGWRMDADTLVGSLACEIVVKII